MATSCLSTPMKKRTTARRCLFGRPDSAATNQWLHEKLEEVRVRAENRWGFNFVMDCPMPGTSDFEFCPILDNSVPEYYRTKYVSSSSTVNSPTKENDLLDTSSGSIDSSEDGDISMDCTLSPIEPSKRTCATPKKRQGKVTDFLHVQRKKRLQRSPKSLESGVSSRRASFESRT